MTLSVVDPPEPILTPADIPGTHTSSDPRMIALIAAVTEQIDAPNGWLGRSLGEQTLLLTRPDFGCGDLRLLYPNVQSVTSVKYLDSALNEQTVSTDVYRHVDDKLVLKPGKSWPTTVCSQPDAVRITYVTGFDDVPASVKQAIILMVRQLQATSDRSGASSFLSFESVEGVGQFRYTMSREGADYVQRAVTNLLSGLRVY